MTYFNPDVSTGADVPIGSVVLFAANSPPANFLECDGSTISRTTYAQLFAVISTTWGIGDGATTFNIPDYRGEFIRGWDNGRGVDPARVFAASQAATAHAWTRG